MVCRAGFFHYMNGAAFGYFFRPSDSKISQTTFRILMKAFPELSPDTQNPLSGIFGAPGRIRTCVAQRATDLQSVVIDRSTTDAIEHIILNFSVISMHTYVV